MDVTFLDRFEIEIHLFMMLSFFVVYDGVFEKKTEMGFKRHNRLLDVRTNDESLADLFVVQYSTAASFDVALPYCSNDHKMIATSITADEKLRFLIQGIWSRRRSLDSA